MNLYFNGAALDPASALTRNLFSQPATKPVFMLGDNPTVNLYVTDGAGGYDADSGSGSVTPWLAIGNPGAEPTGGTFRLGVSSATSGTLTNSKHYLIATYVAGDDFTNVGASANETGVIFTKNNGLPTSWANGSTIVEVTDAIAYNATAATVQTALNATHAIGASGVTVTKSTAAAVYVVEWNTTGNKDAILNSVTGTLTPDSAVVVSTIRAGTSAVTEKQLVRLTQIPAALQTTWSTISNGWTATLDCNTRGLLDLLGGNGSVNAKLELQLVDGGGDIRTVGQVDCLVRNEVIDEESAIPVPLPSYLTESDSRLELVQNRYAVTALTGGGTALDGIVTGTMSSPTVRTNSLVAFDVSGTLYFYRLETGTDAESSPDVIRPDDYASSTNERVWKLQSVSTAKASSYEAISFSTAGNTDVTPGANSSSHSVAATVLAGAGGYTRTVSILTANASEGDRVAIRFSMPSSTNPVVEVRNATSGGTLLTTINGEATGTPLVSEYTYNGTSWIELGAYYAE
jgi:hypothetical protein